MTLPSGTRLGPYEILSPIGAGGMGEVYRAHDGRLGRDVAIKVPPAELLQNPLALARFEREARAVAALSHPNILDIHDIGTDGGVTYAVTELLRGETLRHRLAAGPLPWPRAVGIAVAIANGLAAAHSRGVVHRDLKPENIFLTEDDRVKILDFGLARLEPAPGAEVSPDRATMTETGTLVGTAGYMSPEQVRGEKVDFRSDFFSLGCVLYEMVTGVHAFAAGTAAETLVAVLREEPTDAVELVPGLPDGLRLIIRHCLAKSPYDRFQSARDLALALEDVAAGVSLRSGRLPGRRRGRRMLLVGAGVAVLALLAAVGLRSILAGRPATDSLAVLPFANASGDPGVEYLSDGISEGLLNGLSRFRSLRVPARASAFAFKGETDPLKAGRALDVRVVLTGKVSRRGDNLIVQAELDDVRRGAQIWGERYDRNAVDLFLVENEILRETSRALNLRLTEEDRARLSRRPTSSFEAYDLYLQGRFHWSQRSPEEIGRSIELYEKAIGLDPRFALAYAGLADSYDLLAFYGALPPKDVLPKQRDAALRALQIDDTIAEAHASLADVRYQFEWDWASAERDFRRAIALNPSCAAAHQWYSNFLSVSGRFEESFQEIALARRLDPLNLVIRNDEGLAQIFAGNDERGMALLRETIALDRKFPLSRLYLGLAAARRGEIDVAMTEAKAAMAMLEGDPDPIALYGYVCARAGRPQEARDALKKLQDLSRARFVSALPGAIVYIGLGENEQALSALETAYEERAGRLVYLRVERTFDPLRHEARFQALVARLKIPGT